jgi:hypothetical protein
MENNEAQVRQRKQRWEKFYDFEQPARRMYLIRFAPDLPPRPYPNPELKKERLEWIWQNYVYHLERMAWLDEDTIPCLDMLTGTELFAEAFGCRVYRPNNDMLFALPLVGSAAEAEKLQVPSLDAPPLALAFEMADALQKQAGAGATFRMVDLQSPMDVAALIWEKKSFYLAMAEAPEVVRGLAEKVKSLQVRFLDEWFRPTGEAVWRITRTITCRRGYRCRWTRSGRSASGCARVSFCRSYRTWRNATAGWGCIPAPTTATSGIISKSSPV